MKRQYKVGDKVRCIHIGMHTKIEINKLYEISKVSSVSNHVQVKTHKGKWHLSKRFVLINNNLPDELFTL